MLLSEVLETLQDIRVALRQVYRIGNYQAVEKVLDSLTYLTIKLKKEGITDEQKTNRVGEVEKEG
jgi:hypothetical protein